MHTWFLIRGVDGQGNEILKISQTFVADQDFESGKIEPSCSLAQAFLCFILLALSDSVQEEPISLSVSRVSSSLKKRKKKQAREKSCRSTKRNSSMRKKGGIAGK